MKIYKKIVSYAIAFAFIFITGGISSSFINTSSKWYLDLSIPVFQPKGVVFSLAWVIIYILMVILLSETIFQKNLRNSLYYWFAVGILNIFWCIGFFAFKNPLLSLGVLTASVVLSLFMQKYYTDNTKYGFLLFLPIMLWYMFAWFLNYSIVLMN